MVYQGCSACHTVMRTRVKDASLNEDHRIIDFSDHTEKGAFSADLQPRTGRIEMRKKKKKGRKKKSSRQSSGGQMRETGVMIMRHHKPRVEHPRS